MANIKGITIELGMETKGLDKALADVNKQSRDIAKELREVEKGLKFNPKDTTLLAQKQKLLGDQVATTKEKLDKLKAAEKQVQEQFQRGEISEEQYRSFQREIVETESKLKHYEKQLKEVTTAKSRFGQRMDELSRKMDSAGKKMQNVGGKLSKTLTAPILGAVGAVVGLTKKTGEYADRLLDLSAITGMSTDSIQEWQHVARVAGVDTETMTSAVEGLVRKLPQLEAEGGRATESLSKLGLSYDDLNKMSPDQQVDTLMKRLSEIEDPLERNAIGAQLFGGAWKDIAPILDMGADGISAAKDEAHELGTVLGEDALNDANNFRVEMDKLKGVVGAAAMKIGADFAPLLSNTLGPLIKDTIVPALQDFIEKIRGVIEWFQGLSPKTQENIAKLVGLVAAIGPLLVIFGKVSSFVGTKLVPGFKLVGLAIGGISAPIAIAIGAVAAIIAVGVLLYRNWDTIKEKASQLWSKIKSVFAGIRDAISAPINKARDTVRGAIDSIKSAFNFKFKWPKLPMPKFAISGSMNPVRWIKDGVPKLSVKWNAKGAIFTKPHIFGNQGVGEAGPEAVLPISKLAGMIVDVMKKLELRNNTQQLAFADVNYNHTGVIRVEGINNKGQMTDVVNIVMDQLRREVRK